jgi:glucose uptake protein GlcU
MLENCSEACGWIAGLVAALSFGTFGVPIKSVKDRIKVDPLVMQSYKTLICFITCWFVIPLGEPLRFTPWGIVSGMFWVPGATAGIYGIQNAGLAVSVGTWSSLIVISSFCWGIIVFGESVKSKFQALLASFVLILGLIGMSFYSAPVKEKISFLKKGKNKKIKKGIDEDDENLTSPLLVGDSNVDESNLNMTTNASEDMNKSMDFLESSSDEENGEVELIPLTTGVLSVEDVDGTGTNENNKSTVVVRTSTATNKDFAGGKIIKRRKKELKKTNRDKDVGVEGVSDTKNASAAPNDNDELIHFFGMFSLTKRQLGLLGAIINGVWGSNNMIPMHYARAQGFYGAGYLISYSVGSMIVTVALWLIRYSYNVYYYNGDFNKAFNALPQFHFRILIVPGSLAGFLYSLGNFCSIITVTALGQGVGYSFVQTSMLVSGLWGIFYFGEVKGSERIFKWMMSSIVTLIGILSLSYEHQGSAAH